MVLRWEMEATRMVIITWFTITADTSSMMTRHSPDGTIRKPLKLQTMEGWINDGVMPSLETMSENGNDVLFESGKVAMITQGSWMLAAYCDNEYTAANCDCVELPKSATTGRRASIITDLVGRHLQQPNIRMKLLKYLGPKKLRKNRQNLENNVRIYRNI